MKQRQWPALPLQTAPIGQRRGGGSSFRPRAPHVHLPPPLLPFLLLMNEYHRSDGLITWIGLEWMDGWMDDRPPN